jgi:hypothetical protein
VLCHDQDYLTYYRDLIAIQAIALVNAGMCDYHVRVCPPSQQLKEVCEEVSMSHGSDFGHAKVLLCQLQGLKAL